MSKRCFIIGAGDNSGTIFDRKNEDFIIAADGGYKILRQLGIEPDLIIGDFDSMDFVPSGDKVIRYPVKKDKTDMAISIEEAINRGYKQITIFGGTGGRIDHTIANLQLMAWASRKGISINMIDKSNEYHAITNNQIEITGKEGKLFSVFSMSEKAFNVSIIGGEYEAENIDLSGDNPLGVSNAFKKEQVMVKVEQGTLLVIKER